MDMGGGLMGGGMMGGGMFIIFSFIIFFPVNCIIECLGPGWLYNIMCFFTYFHVCYAGFFWVTLG